MAHTNLGKTQNSGLLYTEINKCLAVDASDNVGIGITAPNTLLNLYKNSSAGVRLVFQNVTTGSDIANRGLLLGINAAEEAFFANYSTTDMFFLTDGNEIMRITAGGNVGIGTTTPSVNADMTLEGGALCIKETTTPTADTNYGKIYTKNDNKLYFQDGAGAEHEIAFV